MVYGLDCIFGATFHIVYTVDNNKSFLYLGEVSSFWEDIRFGHLYNNILQEGHVWKHLKSHELY